MSTGHIPRACVIGHPVAHSRSPLLHNYWLRTLGIPGHYAMEDIAPEALAGFFARFQRQGYVGFNVTVPHKQTAAKFVNRIEPAASAIGAINTVWIDQDEIVGSNTDAHGFLSNLDENIPDWHLQARRGLILGAGGAARAAAYALIERGLGIDVINRSIDSAAGLATHFGPQVAAHGMAALESLLADADIVVQATSLGMLGKPQFTADLSPLKASAIVYDLVYVPLETHLLRAAKARGLRTVDGLGMLLHQAVMGFERWFGVLPKVTADLRGLIEEDIRANSRDAPR